VGVEVGKEEAAACAGVWVAGTAPEATGVTRVARARGEAAVAMAATAAAMATAEGRGAAAAATVGMAAAVAAMAAVGAWEGEAEGTAAEAEVGRAHEAEGLVTTVEYRAPGRLWVLRRPLSEPKRTEQVVVRARAAVTAVAATAAATAEGTATATAVRARRGAAAEWAAARETAAAQAVAVVLWGSPPRPTPPRNRCTPSKGCAHPTLRWCLNHQPACEPPSPPRQRSSLINRKPERRTTLQGMWG
jgi:hypothetical protein